MKSRGKTNKRKNPKEQVLRAIAMDAVAAVEGRGPECREDTGYLVTVIGHHVTDKHGRHRWLTNREFAITELGGFEAFKEFLGRQFQAFEPIGTVRATRSRILRQLKSLIRKQRIGSVNELRRSGPAIPTKPMTSNSGFRTVEKSVVHPTKTGHAN
jgi:hypothetical protein